MIRRNSESSYLMNIGLSYRFNLSHLSDLYLRDFPDFPKNDDNFVKLVNSKKQKRILGAQKKDNGISIGTITYMTRWYLQPVNQILITSYSILIADLASSLSPPTNILCFLVQSIQIFFARKIESITE